MITLLLEHDHPRRVNPWQIAFVDESERHSKGSKVTMAGGVSFDVRNSPEEVEQLWVDAMGAQELMLSPEDAAALEAGVAEQVAGAVRG